MTYDYPYLRYIIDMSSFFTAEEELKELRSIEQELTDLRNENNALRVEIQCLNEKISKAKDDLE